MADSAHTGNLSKRAPTLREVTKVKGEFIEQLQQLSTSIVALNRDYRTLRADISEYRPNLEKIAPPPGYDPGLTPNTAFAWCVDYIANRLYGSWYGKLIEPAHSNIQDSFKELNKLVATQYDPQYRELLVRELKRTGNVPAEQMQVIELDAAKLEADFATLQSKAKAIIDRLGPSVERCFPQRKVQ